MTVRRRGALVGLVGSFVVGCTPRSSIAPDAAPPDAPATSATNVSASDASSDAPPTRTPCDDLAAPSPTSGKSVGHTSVVFKLELSDGRKVAWKPNARDVRGRYKGEIAAFRLAERLGIGANVPPACFAVFDGEAVGRALAPRADAARLLAAEVIADHGRIPGVVIPWIEGLRFLPLEKEPLQSQARGWLKAKVDLPTDKVALARQISDLVVFDFLTTNWDRYSGENVGLDRLGATVLFIDNDAAFMEAPPREALARNRALLTGTDRFSRALVRRLELVDEAWLTSAFGEETPGEPLLAPAIVRGVAARGAELKALLAEKKKAHGEAETLFFP